MPAALRTAAPLAVALPSAAAEGTSTAKAASTAKAVKPSKAVIEKADLAWATKHSKSGIPWALAEAKKKDKKVLVPNETPPTHYNLNWSKWVEFVVDTTGPGQPKSITSQAYPEGQWGGGAGTPGQFDVETGDGGAREIRHRLEGRTER